MSPRKNIYKIWYRKLRELDSITDKEGVPIDNEIKETVAALNLLGIPTSKSCAGHIKGRLRYPFILGWAEGRPQERFAGDFQIRYNIAKKYHLDVNDIELNPEVAREYYNIIRRLKLTETKEYKKWKNKNKLLRHKLRNLLKEFYSHRTSLPNCKLHLAPSLGYLLVIRSHKSKNYKKITYTSKEIPKIKNAQIEIQAFTLFLKKKLFKSSNVN